MEASVSRREAPASQAEAAELMRKSGEAGGAVRPVGGATKLGWGIPVAEPALELSTSGLDRIVEHNEGDLTAIVEAGVPLARAQAAFAEAGQTLALDPPLGEDEAATVGGVVATADSGPLRHRYAAARDLTLGVTIALSDGTVAHSGGKVIKNVAGYDLAKLFTGSFGTLGLILQVAVRLHPRQPGQATAVAASDDPEAVARAASALAHSHIEKESLDVSWNAGHGMALARFGGNKPREQAEAAVRELEGGELLSTEVVEDDDALWEAQRAGQRSAEGTVVRVSGVETELGRLLGVAERLGASVVGRAALGVSWVKVEDGRGPDDVLAAVEGLRAELAPSACIVLDAPRDVRERVDVWEHPDPASMELMRRLKDRFDPAGVCNPGIFVGGI